MKIKWQLLPFARLFLFLAAGIICAYNGYSILTFGGIITFFIITCSVLWLIKVFSKQKYLSILAYFCVAVVGYLLLFFTQEQVAYNPINSHSQIFVQVLENPKLKKTYSAKSKIIKSVSDSNFTKGHHVMIHAKPRETVGFQKNDILFLNCKLKAVNNDTDGYHRYLKSRNIQWICYADTMNWQIVHRKTGQYSSKLHEAKDNSQKKLNRYISENKKAAILSAMIFADKSQISPDDNEAFKRSGSMHILAVSGLHVGIIYMLILSMIKSIPLPFRLKKYSESILTCLLIWVYVMVIGSPSSASRAAFMFSMLCIAKIVQRDYHPINILALSAMIQSLINPFVLFQVGFQYSYSAMIGILLFMPLLQGLVSPKMQFLKTLWLLFCVSFCAQMAIAPLSLYYFGSVSLVSSFSSLLVVPVASISISSSLFIVILGDIVPFVADLLSEISSTGISIILKTNQYFSSFSFAESSFELKFIQLIVIYAVLLFAPFAKSINTKDLNLGFRSFSLLTMQNLTASLFIFTFSLSIKWVMADKAGEVILLANSVLPINQSFHQQQESYLPKSNINREKRASKIEKTSTSPNIYLGQDENTEKKDNIAKHLNPNQCTADELTSSGLPSFAIQNMIKYREKGAKFYNVQSIKKVYGMEEIPESELLQIFYFPKPNSESVSNTSKLELKIDINLADQETLEQLRGIGPVLAGRIIKFRESLGGYQNVRQISEVYGLPDSTFKAIEPQLLCTSKINKIKINQINEKALAWHPYVSFKEAKLILKYREIHGDFENVNSLRQIIPLKEDFIQKLDPYLDFSKKKKELSENN